MQWACSTLWCDVRKLILEIVHVYFCLTVRLQKYVRCQGKAADSEREHFWRKSEQDFQALNASRLLVLRQLLTSLQELPAEGIAGCISKSKDPMASSEAAGSSVTDIEVVLSVLAGLPDPCNTVVEVLQMQDDLSIDKAKPKLLQLEQQVMSDQPAISQQAKGSVPMLY